MSINVLPINDIQLAYECFGSKTDDTIVLIAGLGTQMIRWTSPFCEMLAARGFHVIRFDNRDVGYSTHFDHFPTLHMEDLAATLMSGQQPHIPYTLDEMAADVIGLLDALSIGRAHVVGRSMGGMIAQLMASHYPERVSSITSIMSSSGNPDLPAPAPDVMEMMTRPMPSPFEDEAAFLAQSVAFAKRIAGSGFAFDEEAYVALILEEVHRVYDPGSVGRQIAAIAVNGDRRSQLASIAVPALMIHGTDDPLFLPICGQDTALSIPNSDWMLIEGMGHDLPPQLYPFVVDAIQTVTSRSST